MCQCIRRLVLGAITLIGLGLGAWSLGLGAEIDVVAFMVARYFGVPSFASIYGLAVFAIALLGDAHAIREFVKSTLG